MTQVDPRSYQALVVRKGLRACQQGFRLNRAYTPTNLKRTVENLTGLTFKRGQYDAMADALTKVFSLPPETLKKETENA